MKKITIISYSFPPSNSPAAQRPYSIAYFLGKEGYEVNVISCSNQDSSLGFGNENISNNRYFKLYKIPSLSLKILRKFFVNKTVDDKSTKGNKNEKTDKRLIHFAYPDKAIGWMPFVLIWSVFNFRKFSKATIITTSPLFTNHVIGLVLKILLRKYWIADFRDFHYIKNVEDKSMSFLSRLNKYLEKKVICKSDRVTFISETMHKIYSECYKEYSEKFHVIYNGYNPEEVESEKNFNLTDSPVRIFYAGSFYAGIRSPFPLISLLQKLIDDGVLKMSDVVIEIAGNFEIKLLQKLEEYGVGKNVKFLGLLPREEVIKKMKESHLLWLIVGDDITHSAGIPLKAFEYIAANRPILCFAPENTETPNMIKEIKAGWVFSNNNCDFDKNYKLLQFVLSNKLYLFYKDNGLLLNYNKYNRHFQAIEFAQLIILN